VRAGDVGGRALLIVALLALFTLAAGTSLRLESVTFDETAHLPAGFTYLDRGDFRLNPEHPPLVKLWAALPLWLGSTQPPDYASAAWSGQSAGPGPERSKASQWVVGYEWLNGALHSAERRDPARCLVPARLMMLVPGLLLGLVAYRWSREMWGSDLAGILTLSLYCVSPTMLAHTRLVTTDLPIALAYTATLWTFWRFTRAPGCRAGTVFAAVCAASQLVKFSSLLLFPIVALLGLAWIVWAGAPAGSRRRRMLWTAAAIAGAALLSIPVIWGGYGFRFAASADPWYRLDWQIVGPAGAWAETLYRTALRWRLLPEAYLYGLAYFLGGAARRLAYLNGEQSIVGWWYYFPEAFLLKTPPATLALTGWLTWSAARRRRLGSFDGWFLVAPAVIYLGVSIAGNLDIGHRHLTPIYPLLFVGLGGVTRLLPDAPRARWALAALLAGCVATFVVATPRYLSYFNALAGGPSGGPRYLLDSNIDWGQDLPRLKRWLDAHGEPEVHLAYFGTGDPKAYGIRYRKLRMVHDFRPWEPERRPGQGDLLAVSVNLLHGLYLDDERELAETLVRRGWVEPETIQQWLQLRDELSRRGRRHPALDAWLIEQQGVSPDRVAEVRSGLLAALFERLRTQARPVGQAGDSIYLYRLDVSF